MDSRLNKADLKGRYYVIIAEGGKQRRTNLVAGLDRKRCCLNFIPKNIHSPTFRAAALLTIRDEKGNPIQNRNAKKMNFTTK
ncbi:hypothetical protein ABIB50_001974 [Mucilaginibacter sp. UYCu711]